MRHFLLPLALLCAVLATPAHADTKRFGLTSFDRVEISGDMIVEIAPSNRISAVAEGSRVSLETLDMEVRNRVLLVSQRSMGAYGPRRASDGPLRIRLTAQNLGAVDLRGSGQLRVTGLRGREVVVTLHGAGTIDAAVPAGLRVSTRVEGPGTITLTGRSQSLIAIVAGSGSVDASGLAVRDLDVRSNGTGTSSFAANGRVRVIALGAANVTVAGAPRCTVTNSGAGTVECGVRQRDALPTTGG